MKKNLFFIIMLLEHNAYGMKRNNNQGIANTYDPTTNQIDSRGYTALHHAILYKNPKIVNILLDKGANPNGNPDNQKISPLILAVQGGAPLMVQILLKNGADINYQTTNKITALSYAIKKVNPHITNELQNSFQEILYMLLQQYPDLSSCPPKKKVLYCYLLLKKMI